jgi:hypothetical protein
MTDNVIKQHLSSFAPKQKEDIKEKTVKKVTDILRGDKGENILMVLVCRTDVVEYHKFGKAFQKIAEAVAQAKEESPATDIFFRNIVPAHAVGLSDMAVPEPTGKK